MKPQKTPPATTRKPRESRETGELVNVTDKTPPLNPAPAKAGKRRRLARAFSYPLDEVIRNQNEAVRERISLPKNELDALLARKAQLLAQGVEVKKRELVRLGLHLLKDKTDGEIVILLGKLAKMPAGGKKPKDK